MPLNRTYFICLVALLGACNAAGSDKEAWTPTSTGKADDSSTVDMGPLGFGDRLAAVDIGKDASHRYQFDAARGAEIAVDMSSATVDAYLTLVGPGGAIEGFDDDGGGDLDARIHVASLAETGTYTIMATTYRSAGTGSYDLELSCLGDRCTPDDGTAGPWQAPADPLDPSTCAGEPLSAQELLGWVPLPAQTSLPLGELVFHGRQRTCYAAQGACTDWEAADVDELLIVDYPSCNGVTGCTDITWHPTAASVTLHAQNDQPVMSFDFTGQEAYEKRSSTNDYARTAPDLDVHGNRVWWNIESGTPGNSRSILFEGRVTATCLAVVARGVETARDADGNQLEIEREIGAYLTGTGG